MMVFRKRIQRLHQAGGFQRWLIRTALISCSALAMAASVQAQQPASGTKPASTAQTPPAVTPIPSEPQATTAVFGDWVLKCVRQNTPPAVQRICEVTQTLQLQNQRSPFALIAIGRISKTDPLKLTAILPGNISFPSVVKITVDDNDKQPTELIWRKCLPTGCIADTDPSPAIIQKLRAAPESIRLQFRDSTGQELLLPLSTKGLPQALDALSKEQ